MSRNVPCVWNEHQLREKPSTTELAPHRWRGQKHNDDALCGRREGREKRGTERSEREDGGAGREPLGWGSPGSCSATFSRRHRQVPRPTRDSSETRAPNGARQKRDVPGQGAGASRTRSPRGAVVLGGRTPAPGKQNRWKRADRGRRQESDTPIYRRGTSVPQVRPQACHHESRHTQKDGEAQGLLRRRRWSPRGGLSNPRGWSNPSSL